MTIIAVISDTHTGSTTALAPPKFETHVGRDSKETQTSTYNEYQKWLYECWRHYWTTVLALAGVRGKDRKHRLVIFHLGDIVDGDHHHTPQIMPEVADQIAAACDLLRPVFALADRAYLTYGTGAHNGGTGEFEASVASELGVRIAYDYSLSIDGVTFDLGHHGRAGRLDQSSSAAGVATETARDYQKDGKAAPRFVLRGHCHHIDDSGFKLPDTRAIMLPSWQLKTNHGHQVAPNQRRADIGGLIIDTNDPDNPRMLRYVAPGGSVQTEVVW